MFIPSYRIAPGANRKIMPPFHLGAALRQTSFAARRVELRERVNMADRRAATATQNPKSTASCRPPASAGDRLRPVSTTLLAARRQVVDTDLRRHDEAG
jgi:hypothetical protein